MSLSNFNFIEVPNASLQLKLFLCESTSMYDMHTKLIPLHRDDMMQREEKQHIEFIFTILAHIIYYWDTQYFGDRLVLPCFTLSSCGTSNLSIFKMQLINNLGKEQTGATEKKLQHGFYKTLACLVFLLEVP